MPSLYAPFPLPSLPPCPPPAPPSPPSSTPPHLSLTATSSTRARRLGEVERVEHDGVISEIYPNVDPAAKAAVLARLLLGGATKVNAYLVDFYLPC